MKIRLLPDIYSVCRMESGAPVPGWAFEGGFFSVTGTGEELSVVCLQKNIPAGIKQEKGWSILKIQGPLDFSLVGILSSVSSLLAKSKISIFAVSTYDTDYILVKEKDKDKAVAALSDENFEVIC